MARYWGSARWGGRDGDWSALALNRRADLIPGTRQTSGRWVSSNQVLNSASREGSLGPEKTRYTALVIGVWYARSWSDIRTLHRTPVTATALTGKGSDRMSRPLNARDPLRGSRHQFPRQREVIRLF